MRRGAQRQRMAFDAGKKGDVEVALPKPRFPSPEIRPGTTPHTKTEHVQFSYATIVFRTEVSHEDYN